MVKQTIILTLLILLFNTAGVVAQNMPNKNVIDDTSTKSKFLGSKRNKVEESDSESDVTQLKDSIGYYITIINQQKREIDSLNYSFEPLLKFKKEFTRQKLSDANKVMSVRLPKMDKNAIADMVILCDEYRGDSEFDSLRTRLTDINNLKNTFDDYSQLLDNRVSIKDLSSAINNINNSSESWSHICTDEQLSNINTLKKNLRAMYDGVSAFAILIKTIDKELKRKDLQGSINPQNESWLIKEVNYKVSEVIEIQKEDIDYFILGSVVPYLVERYKLYITELEKNPIVPNEIVVDIENEMLNAK